ncbi:MAG: ATP cone domain-containing protein, partial [Eubacteriales bacterium]|nr:ATP cone domain-containing protein [Eubacteriales bacterium]
TEQIDNLIRSIELQYQNSLQREISSVQIGEMVMDRLKQIDEVAYVRFASVYRQFKDVNSFLRELKDMLGQQSTEVTE